mmetsp:Transcript_733/g.2820  ORF Transcript_733/g.2820 Transcript_733/m.2820 type:complete len:299 (-) Transcript_733:5160-6056(-)
MREDQTQGPRGVCDDRLPDVHSRVAHREGGIASKRVHRGEEVVMPLLAEGLRERPALRLGADALVIGPALEVEDLSAGSRDAEHHRAHELGGALPDAPVLRADAVLDGRQEEVQRRSAVRKLLHEHATRAERRVAHGFHLVREAGEHLGERLLQVGLKQVAEREGQETKQGEVPLSHVRRDVVAPGEDLREHRLEVLLTEHGEALRQSLSRAASLRHRPVALQRLREPGDEIRKVLVNAAHAPDQGRQRGRRGGPHLGYGIDERLPYVREEQGDVGAHVLRVCNKCAHVTRDFGSLLL